MKINALFLLTIACSYTTLFAQVELDTVVAQKGDGIFSILRRSGIHPVNYYVDFLELNKDNIRGASQLVVGRKYVLPYAPDSYKNMGTLVDVDGNEELPLFTTDLAGIKQRDSTLKNTVYHLIYPTIKTKEEEKSPLDEFILKLSKDLMERGARVYVFQKNNMIFPVDTVASEVERAIAAFGELTSMVNKKYLKHNGSYQRVLMIRDVNRNKKGISMAMYHYGKSTDGKHLAATFRDLFKKNALGKVKIEQGISPFTDAPNLYLAKNLLPTLTIMDINGDMNGIPIRSRKSALPGLITEGILQDYATVNSAD
jgi:N-acetylmuramoyl-L-alanine amidase